MTRIKKRRNVVTSTVLTSSRGAQQSRHDASRVCCSAPAPADVYRQLERGIDNELSWMNFTVFYYGSLYSRSVSVRNAYYETMWPEKGYFVVDGHLPSRTTAP